MTKGPQAVLIHMNDDPLIHRFTVAAGTTISKGILCSFADPNTASEPGTTANGIFAGITNADKDGSDSSTDLGLWQNGLWDIRASGAITAGDKVLLACNNEVRAAPLALSSQNPALASLALSTTGIVVGTARETATDQEVILVDIGRR